MSRAGELWEQAWRDTCRPSTVERLRALRAEGRLAEAARVEDEIHEQQELEFRRLCEAEGVEVEAEHGPERARRRRRA